MLDYSHRDRRAHREVARGFWSMVGSAAALIGAALYLPVPFAGLAGVVALGGLGIGYLAWSDRLLEEYSEDLRRGRRDEASGFRRVELGTPVGLERVVGRPTARSPHSRRRSPTAVESPEEALSPERSRSG